MKGWWEGGLTCDFSVVLLEFCYSDCTGLSLDVGETVCFAYSMGRSRV